MLNVFQAGSVGPNLRQDLYLLYTGHFRCRMRDVHRKCCFHRYFNRLI